MWADQRGQDITFLFSFLIKFHATDFTVNQHDKLSLLLQGLGTKLCTFRYIFMYRSRFLDKL